MNQIGAPFECISIPVVIQKELVTNQNADPNSQPEYRSGFRIGGGIDQNPTLSPQQYPDKGIYVTMISPDGPAARSNLQVNDKLLQVNGYDFTIITHKTAVEFLKKGKVLNMLVFRPSPNSSY